MGLYKRGSMYFFDFTFQGKRHQGSTHTKNKEVAKQIVTKIRNDLALGLVGLKPREPSPPFQDFLEKTFMQHVRQNEKAKRTTKHYQDKVKRLLAFPDFKTVTLEQVDTLRIQSFKDWRLRQKTKKGKPYSIITINGELRTLRRALLFALKVGLLTIKPFVSLFAGEKGRMFVLTGEMENAYLAVAPSPLKEAAILILDLGLRPEECVSLRKDDITPEGVTVQQGKSVNARRVIPQTERTRKTLEFLFRFFPDSEWVFPGRNGHLRRTSLDNMHAKLRDTPSPTGRGTLFPGEFVLYSMRHTFGTRLAESGAREFAIKELMGHSSVKVSERYVHPSSEHTALAMKRKEMGDKILRGEVHEEAPEKSRIS